MGILTRPLLRPGQRWDLEDFNVGLSALRADSHFYTKTFLSDKAYILNGFTIDQTFLGQTTADVSLDGATLINGNNIGDFSWWTAPESPTPITLPTGVNGLQQGRNYVSLKIFANDGTPLQRAFWDPSANSGAGVEFSQEVNTVTELFVEVSINQTGFDTGDTTLIPLSIIDLDGSLNIKGIRDKRNLYHRLGTADDINSGFVWGSRTEPATTLVFTSPSGTAFTAGETVTFASGASAEVVSGGTNNIQVFNFTTDSFQPGDLVTGTDSGATATLSTYYESFTGADKDIRNQKDMYNALMNEIRLLKGTDYWYEAGPALSLVSLLNFVNTIMAPISNGARFSWTGSALKITDNKTVGQTAADVIAALRIPGTSSDLFLSRQDGTGGSAPLTIPDGNILFVQLPSFGSNRSYLGAGSASNNYQTVARSAFLPTDSNYIIAYREGTKLIIPAMGELKPGEDIDVSGEISKEILAFIGAADETSTNPPYTTVPSGDLSNQFTSSDSLTQAISINAANINDIATALLIPYQETLTVVSGSPADSHEVMGPLSSGSIITLPLDSRNSNAQKQYLVGQGGLFLSLNGQNQVLGIDYLEVGSIGTLSSTIQILQDYVISDEIDIRLFNPQVFGTAGIDQPFFVNYIIGQNGTDIPTGALYNMGTDRLQIWRDGLALNRSLSVGDAIDRYQESTNNSVTLGQAANPDETFVFVNHETPSPNVTLITGITGTVVTVPTYTTGDGSLRVFRNGILLSTNGSAPTDLGYSETSTTSITLSLTASVSDVFKIYRSGAAPTWRVSTIGVTGTNIVVPGGNLFTPGSQKLLVFRNGLLMNNSLVIGEAVEQYQQNSNNSIDLQLAAVNTDLIEFLYV